MNLEELKALCENATPGPWQAKREESFHKSVIAEPDRYGTKYIAEWIFQGPDSGESDAQFIAAARTALPKLIAAVESVPRRIEDYRYDPSMTPEDLLGTIEEIINNALEES